MPAVVAAVAAAWVSDYVATAITTDIGAETLLGELILGGDLSGSELAIGAKVAGGVAGAAAGALVTTALTPAQKKSAAQSFDATARTSLVNTVSTIDSIPVIYGTRKVAGSRTLTEISGASGEYLNLVIVWGEGPISAITTVYLDGVAVSDARFSGLVTQEDHLGSDTQTASSALIAELADTAKWNSNCTLSGLAYTWLRLKWDATAFPGGLPNVTADIDGRTLYDPRSATTAFSHNPALAIRDYLTNTRYGCRVDSTLVDDTILGASATTCEQSVTIPGGTQARYTCDGLIDIDQQPFDNVRALLTSCRGFLVFSGGLYKLKIDQAQTPVSFTLSEDNIIGGWSISLSSKRTRFNRVRAQFFDPDQQWQPNIAIWESTTYRASDDNGLVLEPAQVNLPFTANLYRAQQICQLEGKRSRFAISVSLTATIEATQLEVGDVVPVTHATPGWVAKLFRVVEIELLANDEVRLTLAEYDASVYDLSDLTAPAAAATSRLPDPRTVAAPGIVSVTESIYETSLSAGVSVRATVVIGASADIYVQSGGGYQLEVLGPLDTAYRVVGLGPSTTVFVDDLAPGTYSVRAKAYNSLGAFSTYSAVFTQEILGLSDIPADPVIRGLQPGGDGITAILTLEPHPALDVRRGGRWRVRHNEGDSPAWETSFSIGDAEGYVGDQTIITLPLKPGSYLVKAEDAAGQLSDGFDSIYVKQASVIDFTLVNTLTEDTAFTGTKSGVVAVDSLLKLEGAGLVDGIVDWDSISSLDDYGGVDAAGTYTFSSSFNFGAVTRVRLTTQIVGQAVNVNDLIDDRTADIDDWADFDGDDSGGGLATDAWVEFRESDDNVTWSDWKRVDTAAAEAWYVQCRLQMVSSDPAYNRHINQLRVLAESAV